MPQNSQVSGNSPQWFGRNLVADCSFRQIFLLRVGSCPASPDSMFDAFLSRSPDLLNASESLLLLVDMQERLVPTVLKSSEITRKCEILARGAAIFGVPLVVTEQYPKGLGQTVPELAQILKTVGRTDPRPEKLRFSAAEATGWPPAAERDDSRHHVVIAGIETHICVLQTALDLLAIGYRVFICVDAVSSRSSTDHEIALTRLRDSGAIVTTTESVLFEWCETAGGEQFKQIRDLVIEESNRKAT